MSISSPTSPFIVVIHTNKYSGNFEREMAGYISGIWDGDTHGGTQAEIFKEEVPNGAALTEKACPQPRENGWGHTPVSIWPTPGRRNNGMGLHYDAGDPVIEGEMKLRAKQAMKDYQAPHIKKCQDRLDNEDFEEDNNGRGWTKEACIRTIKSAEESIERAGTTVGFPAYESVAIFLDSMPTDEEIDLMWTRAQRFTEYIANVRFPNTPDLKVTGLEVISRTIVKNIVDDIVDDIVASRSIS